MTGKERGTRVAELGCVDKRATCCVHVGGVQPPWGGRGRILVACMRAKDAGRECFCCADVPRAWRWCVWQRGEACSTAFGSTFANENTLGGYSRATPGATPGRKSFQL
eukprot:323370-Chlamydomonas_euryale.AAC.5